MYYRQPEYYGDFKCIGGDCKFTCCAGWLITWSDEEIAKVKNAPECSEELRALLDSSFKKMDGDDKTMNAVKLGEGQRCPFLTEESLCKIQRELGAEYLSHTCSHYPRKFCQIQDPVTGKPTHFYRSCALSCPEVTKRLVFDKKAMNLVNIPVKQDTLLHGVIKDEDRIKAGHEEYLYRGEMFELFYNLISDKKYSVEASIAYGVLVAALFKVIVEKKNYGDIPRAINEMGSPAVKKEMLLRNEAIKPNYQMKVDFLGTIMEKIVGSNTFGNLKKEDGTVDIERYKKGEETISKMFGGDEYWLRNIALNLLFEFTIPFYSEKYTILESYSLFLIAFACFKLNAIASVAGDDGKYNLILSKDYNAQFEGMDSVWGFASVISRSLCQSSVNAEKLIDLLKKLNLIAPEKLAALIK